MAVRLSTLAEIKAFSLISYARGAGADPNASGTDMDALLLALDSVRQQLGDGAPDTIQSEKNSVARAGARDLFRTIGIARNVRIDENYGTQNVYGIGAPTRPRIVPNNYDVSVTVERLQLDRRDLGHFFANPEYWYSDEVQRDVGIEDFLFYTYFFIKSKEDSGATRSDIFALMPRTSSKTFTSGDVMVANNVSMVGFKYSYKQALLDVSNLVRETITERI